MPRLQIASAVIGRGGFDWQLRCRATAALPRLQIASAVIRRGGFGLATALPSDGGVAASPKQAIANSWSLD
ncbi:MAG: hypothetical protein ACYTXY_28655 [Nostoc sp.]